MTPLRGMTRQSRANHSRLATARRVARLSGPGYSSIRSPYLQAFGALAAATPLHTWALVAQPAVIT